MIVYVHNHHDHLEHHEQIAWENGQEFYHVLALPRDDVFFFCAVSRSSPVMRAQCLLQEGLCQTRKFRIQILYTNL